ncbi:MAG: glycosyltransferase [Pseudodonghicola sp.]
MTNKKTILFIHRNFPGQFRYIADHLARSGHNVFAATGRSDVKTGTFVKLPSGVQLIGYRPRRRPNPDIHLYLRTTEEAILEGQGLANAAIYMRKIGIFPDIIVAHSGWGSGSFAKTVWPDAKFVQYLEWWYDFPARDIAENPVSNDVRIANSRAQTLCRNIPFMVDAVQADAILSPSAFQSEDVPQVLRSRLHVIPDGVDCQLFHPQDAEETLDIAGISFPPDRPIVTFATRGMEPMRGFPQFMAAWAKVQHRCPDAHCIVAGTDTVHYSPKLPAGETYKSRALAEHDFDLDRLHFVGRLPLDLYAGLLRRTNCHVYLTRPFVISWSLFEAMASAAPLVVSDNAATREVLPQEAQALHVDLSDIDQIADAIVKTIESPKAAKTTGNRNRKRVERSYSTDVTLPRLENLLLSLL